MDLSRDTLERHASGMEAFAGCRRVTMEEGGRLVHLYNASGLCADLLPDRGLDLWRVSYRGAPLTWSSRNAPHRGDAGADWLRIFNGGLLTTCGLRHAGPAEVDPETGEARGTHGEYTRLVAAELGTSARWEGENYLLRVWGRMSESSLFGPQLSLVREVRMPLDAPVLELHDVVANEGDSPQPLMVLYHVNLGYPLVRAGAELTVAAGEPVPRDAAASAGLDRWALYEEPRPRYEEQVFFHAVSLDAEGWSRVVIGHEDMGLELSWDAGSAPYFTQWKNTRRGSYVSGIEPGNCLPEGQNRARAAGRLEVLEAGGTREFRLRFRVLDGAEVGAARASVRRLRDTGRGAAVELGDYPRSEA